ncbi:MAG: carbohydrate ABC transporter permease [Chloroflexota bacterium]
MNSKLRAAPPIRKWLERSSYYAALLALCIPFIFPFWWMFTSAFKKPIEIFEFPPPLLPTTWNWQNFVTVFTFQPFARHYFNSIYIALAVTLGTLLFSALAGYAFARIRFKGNSIIFIVLLSALMMPAEVTIVPNFVFMKALRLDNTHFPLMLLPIFGANGIVTTFMMRQFFITLPVELEDAARIDGLGRFGIFWQIAMPIARPALAAVAILTFLYSWNAFLEPFIFLSDTNPFTLPLSPRNYRDEYSAPLWNIQLAATTLSIIPVLIFYVLAQRQVIESFAQSGLKG